MAKVIADVEKEQREELQGTYAARSVGIENQMNSHIFEISSPCIRGPYRGPYIRVSYLGDSPGQMAARRPVECLSKTTQKTS